MWSELQGCAVDLGRDPSSATTGPGVGALERSMMQEVTSWSQAQPSQLVVQPQQVSVVPWPLVQDPRTRPPGFFNGGLNGNYSFYGSNGGFLAYERRPGTGLAQSVVALPVRKSAPHGDFLNGIVRSTPKLTSRCWQSTQVVHSGPSPAPKPPIAHPVQDALNRTSVLNPQPRVERSEGNKQNNDSRQQEFERKSNVLKEPAPCNSCGDVSYFKDKPQPCSTSFVDMKPCSLDGTISTTLGTGTADGGAKSLLASDMLISESSIPVSAKINTKLLPASSYEKLGLKPGRRVTIRPKEWAGEVVWAKLARDPWWPAQVLGDNDPFIPVDADPPRIGAVPVRFFGTYDFAWIESQRSLTPFDCSFQERCSVVDLSEFVQGINEALDLQHNGRLPQGFADAMNESKPSSVAKSKLKSSKTVGGKRQESTRTEKQIPPETRKAKVMRLLGLSPPAGSPYIKNWAINPNLVTLMQNGLR